jgi:hypothetical protein
LFFGIDEPISAEKSAKWESFAGRKVKESLPRPQTREEITAVFRRHRRAQSARAQPAVEDNSGDQAGSDA